MAAVVVVVVVVFIITMIDVVVCLRPQLYHPALVVPSGLPFYSFEYQQAATIYKGLSGRSLRLRGGLASKVSVGALKAQPSESQLQIMEATIEGNLNISDNIVPLSTWIADKDCVIVLGITAFNQIKDVCKGKRTVLIPREEDDPSTLPAAALDTSTTVVAVRGPSSEEMFIRKLETSMIRIVPWASSKPVIRERSTDSNIKIVLVNGCTETRNGCLNGEEIKIKLASSLSSVAIQNIETVNNVEDVMKATHLADIMVFLSSWIYSNAFGIADALVSGVAVITPDTKEIREHVEEGHNGLFYSSPQALVKTVISLVNNPDLLHRLTAPQPGEHLSRWNAFCLHLRAIVFQEPPPRVVSFWPGHHYTHTRTELFHTNALRRAGFHVILANYQANLTELMQQPTDFYLAAKPPVSFLTQLTRESKGLWNTMTDRCVIWTWDLIDYGGDNARRMWMTTAGTMCRFVFLNELGRESMWASLGINQHYLNDGSVTEGDRGLGMRPLTLPTPDIGAQLTFLGGPGDVNSEDPRDHVRLRVLRKLMEQGVEVEIWGDPEKWEHAGFESQGEVWSKDALVVRRQAKVTLSISRTPENIAMYRSDRLLMSTGGAACVVSERFIGQEWFFPRGGIAVVDRTVDWVPTVMRLLGNSSERMEMRRLAEDTTWRMHTWDDSIAAMMTMMKAPLSADPDVSKSGQLWQPNCDSNYRALMARLLEADGLFWEAAIHSAVHVEICPEDSERWKELGSMIAISGIQWRWAYRVAMAASRVDGSSGWLKPYGVGCPATIMHQALLKYGKSVYNQGMRACDSTRLECAAWCGLVARKI